MKGIEDHRLVGFMVKMQWRMKEQERKKDSLFAVGFETPSPHLIESHSALMLPIDLLLLKCFSTFFQLANLKLKGLERNKNF